MVRRWSASRPGRLAGAASARSARISALRVCGDIPDPIARALNGLLDEVTSLRARLSELEKEKAGQSRGSRSGFEASAVAPAGRQLRR